MQGYPNLPNHRTPQSMVSQPSPNFIQQRAQSTFPFGSALQQQQTQQQPQTHQHQQTSMPHTQQTTTQPSNNTSTSLPPHLAPQTAPSTLGTAPSVSSASEVGLDPNDFPALGSTTTGSAATSNSTATGATGGASYASQAGTGVALGGVGGQGSSSTSGGNQNRDFTPDDFPALSGQPQTSQTQQSAHPSQPNQEGHPPGLNGFGQQNSDQQRQTLLGSLGGVASTPSQAGQQQPGLLNLGASRNLHSGFQSEAEKQRNYAMKLNQSNHPAWNSPNPNGGSQTPAAAGAGSYPTQSLQQNGGGHNSAPNHLPQQPSQQHLNAPPGVPPPTSYVQQPIAGHHPAPGAGQQAQQTPYLGNGTPAADAAHAQGGVPQTPAQQVLMSPADRWGLLGLIAMIKNADLDQSMLTVGTDLGTMGMDMTNTGNLYSTFITPWADSSAAHTVEPDFHLPACYSVHPPPPGPAKAQAFSDETLFFMFYSSPRDAMQEVAAQELYNRNWRYHKELRLWLTKEAGQQNSVKVNGGESGTYTYWDPENWEKGRKDMMVMYADLEEKAHPAFAPGLTLQMPTQSQPQQLPQTRANLPAIVTSM